MGGMCGKSVANSDCQLLAHIETCRNDEAKAMLNPGLAKASVDSETLLHHAVRHGNIVITRHLIELGSEVDAIGRGGKTPLMRAAHLGFRGIVGILLEAGASIDIVDEFGKTALQTAFETETFDFFEIYQQFIYRVRADASNTDEAAFKLINAGCTMYHAVFAKDVQLLHCMRKRGAVETNAPDGKRDFIVLHAAARQGNAAVVEWLIDNGPDIVVRNRVDVTPLHCAAADGNVDTVRLLLERGADPNAESHEIGRIPLWDAVLSWRKDEEQLYQCVELLLQYGASLHLRDVLLGGQTIFDAALTRNRWRIIEVLVAHLAILQRLCACDVENVMICNDQKNQAALERIKKIYEMCQQTLDVVVFGTSTLFDLLSVKKDFNRLKMFVRNETFTVKVLQVCSKHELGYWYAYYYKNLMKHIAKARRIVELENKAIPVIVELFEGSYNQCFDFARKVVGYLNERDLEQLILV